MRAATPAHRVCTHALGRWKAALSAVVALSLSSCAHKGLGPALELEATRAALRVELTQEQDSAPPPIAVIPAEEEGIAPAMSGDGEPSTSGDPPADAESSLVDDPVPAEPGDDPAVGDPERREGAAGEDRETIGGSTAEDPGDAAVAASADADPREDVEEERDIEPMYPETIPLWEGTAMSVRAMQEEVRGGAGSERMIASMDRLARSLDEKRWQEVLEARLDDKQRQLDRLNAGMDRALGISSEGPDAGESEDRVRVNRALVEASENARAASQTAAKAWEEAAAARALAQQTADEQRKADVSLGERLEAIELRLEELAARETAASGDGAGSVEAAAGEDATAEAELAEVVQQLSLEVARLREQPPVTTATPAATAPALSLEEAALQQASRTAGRSEDAEVRKHEDRIAQLEAQLDQLGRSAAIDRERRRAMQTVEDERRQLERERLELEAERSAAPAAPSTSPPPVISPILVTSTDDGELDELREDLAERDGGIQVRMAELELRLAESSADRERLAVLEDSVAGYADDQELLELMTADLSRLKAERANLDDELSSADEARKAELEARRIEHEEQTAELMGEIERLRRHQEELERRYVHRQDAVLEQLQPLVDAGLSVESTGGRIRVKLPADVLFSSGSSALSRDGQAAVLEVGAVLRRFPALRVQVEGHTDNVPVRGGRVRSNWDLAFMRASSVLQALIDSQFPTDRISAASYGDTQPAVSNTTAEGRRANRRIELVLQLDSVEEGKTATGGTEGIAP